MLRTIQLLACLCVLCLAGGCGDEVKEIPASKSNDTPAMSEEDKKALEEGDKKHQTSVKTQQPKSKTK